MSTRTTELRRARLRSVAAAQAVAALPDSGRRDLAIARLRIFPLREPASRRRYTILKLETRSGLAGFGESTAITAPAAADAAARLAGMDATAVEVARQRLRDLPAVAAAVDMAMLDIVGQATKRPVYQVLGGPTRNKARALAPLAGDDDAALRDSLAAARAAGYRAFLVPAPRPPFPNSGKAFVQTVRKRMDALRAAAVESGDFVLDAAAALTPGDAALLSAELERFHLLWFDEPCRTASLAAIRKLSWENVTPLGFGRTAQSGSEFQDLLREQAIDVLRPPLAMAGISGIRRYSALAEAYYVAVAPYHDGGPVATAAALHLAASLPNFYIQQVPLPAAEQDRRMRAEIVSPAVETVKDGFLELPARPGLGIAVNEQALQKYTEAAQ